MIFLLELSDIYKSKNAAIWSGVILVFIISLMCYKTDFRAYDLH